MKMLKKIIELLRTPRIFGMAIFDWLMTALAAYIINPQRFFLTFILLTILAILIHMSLGISTPLNRYLGLDGTID